MSEFSKLTKLTVLSIARLTGWLLVSVRKVVSPSGIVISSVSSIPHWETLVCQSRRIYHRLIERMPHRKPIWSIWEEGWIDQYMCGSMTQKRFRFARDPIDDSTVSHALQGLKYEVEQWTKLVSRTKGDVKLQQTESNFSEWDNWIQLEKKVTS